MLHSVTRRRIPENSTPHGNEHLQTKFQSGVPPSWLLDGILNCSRIPSIEEISRSPATCDRWPRCHPVPGSHWTAVWRPLDTIVYCIINNVCRVKSDRTQPTYSVLRVLPTEHNSHNIQYTIYQIFSYIIIKAYLLITMNVKNKTLV